MRRKAKGYDIGVVLKIGEKNNSNNALELRKELNKKTMIYIKKRNSIIFNNGSVSIDVDVSIKEETVWLNQNQIAVLFDTTQQNVSLHIKNILLEEELELNSIHKESLYTAKNGKNFIVDFYNLDMIFAVGYRVKGRRAIEFRKNAS